MDKEKLNELKKEYFQLGNTIGELGSDLYALKGRIAGIIIDSKFKGLYKGLLEQEENLTNSLERLKKQYKKLQKIINEYE